MALSFGSTGDEAFLFDGLHPAVGIPRGESPSRRCELEGFERLGNGHTRSRTQFPQHLQRSLWTGLWLGLTRTCGGSLPPFGGRRSQTVGEALSWARERARIWTNRMDHRVVCPNCHKQGTVKSNNGIPDGAKLRCAGCGYTYSYQESYDLQPEANPSPGTAPISGLIPTTPQAKPKQRTRNLTRSTLIGYCVRLPGWVSIAAGTIQCAILIGGNVLGIFGVYSSGMGKYRAEAAALVHQKQAGQEHMAELTTHMQQNTNQMQQLAYQMQQLINGGLKIEVQAVVPRLAPMEPAQQPQPTPMERYLELKGQYESRQQELKTLKDEYDALELKVTDLDKQTVSRPGLFDGIGTAMIGSALASAAFPLLIAWLAWITGLVLVVAGVCWLALVRLCYQLMEAT